MQLTRQGPELCPRGLRCRGAADYACTGTHNLYVPSDRLNWAGLRALPGRAPITQREF